MADLAIQAHNLRKTFGDVIAVDDVSLEVPTGTVLGVLGPNGAGKTTTVRMLTTLARPDSGSATVAGIDVLRHPSDVRKQMGLTGQFAAVDENLTGRENLRMVARLTHLPKRSIEPRIDELLGFFSLTDAGDRVSRTYSGGMRRRLDLAASLVHTPPVLFLDEPTSGLDPASRNELWGVIEGLVNDGTTVLLTTQYLEEADRLADRIVVIDNGLVIAEGTAAELKGRLGRTIVEITFADTPTAGTAERVVAPLGETSVVTDTVSVRVEDGSSALFAVVRLLDSARIAATNVVVREPSLDDVFLTLTGRSATSESPDDTSIGPAPTTSRRSSKSTR